MAPEHFAQSTASVKLVICNVVADPKDKNYWRYRNAYTVDVFGLNWRLYPAGLWGADEDAQPQP